MENTIEIYSEVSPLKAVLLHKPGKELENLTPETIEDLLFEDIPWLDRMRDEHDYFASIFIDNGCDVYYYEELLTESCMNSEASNFLISAIVKSVQFPSTREAAVLMQYLLTLAPKELARIAIEGLSINDFSKKSGFESLSTKIKNSYSFIISPSPNLYFSRDPASVIGSTVNINSMYKQARRNESIIIETICKYNSLFNNSDNYLSKKSNSYLEGGDILTVSKDLIVVGCSQRSQPAAIEDFAQKTLNENNSFNEVIVVEIPDRRSFMHLDTIFTMVDYDKFLVYPEIETFTNSFSLKKSIINPKELSIHPLPNLQNGISKALGRKIHFIESGGKNKISAAREQWNDSTNCLAIAPGKVITYKRNRYSNETLRNSGVEVLEIEGSELLRGRGGPRCMSMPLKRLQ